MAAQFFSSLADNALLIAAIAMLAELDGPPWVTPLLKFFFTISYVVLAFAVGTGLLVLAAVLCATVLRTVDVHGQEPAQELEPAAA